MRSEPRVEASGAPGPFADLFDRHYDSVWRYLARSSGRTVADDLAGEVFEIALRRWAAFDPERGTERAWLFGIARNVVRSRRRFVLRSQRAVDFSAGVAMATAVSTGLDDVLVALRELSANEREILLLFAWEELSYEEIAALLNVPIGTVRSRLARARQHLRALLALTEGEVR